MLEGRKILHGAVVVSVVALHGLGFSAACVVAGFCMTSAIVHGIATKLEYPKGQYPLIRENTIIDIGIFYMD